MNKKILTVAHVLALVLASNVHGSPYKRARSYFNCSASACGENIRLAINCGLESHLQEMCAKAAARTVEDYKNPLIRARSKNATNKENAPLLQEFESLGKLDALLSFFTTRIKVGNWKELNGKLHLNNSNTYALEAFQRNSATVKEVMNSDTKDIPEKTPTAVPIGHPTITSLALSKTTSIIPAPEAISKHLHPADSEKVDTIWKEYQSIFGDIRLDPEDRLHKIHALQESLAPFAHTDQNVQDYIKAMDIAQKDLWEKINEHHHLKVQNLPTESAAITPTRSRGRSHSVSLPSGTMPTSSHGQLPRINSAVSLASLGSPSTALEDWHTTTSSDDTSSISSSERSISSVIKTSMTPPPPPPPPPPPAHLAAKPLVLPINRETQGAPSGRAKLFEEIQRGVALKSTPKTATAADVVTRKPLETVLEEAEKELFPSTTGALSMMDELNAKLKNRRGQVDRDKKETKIKKYILKTPSFFNQLSKEDQAILRKEFPPAARTPIALQSTDEGTSPPAPKWIPGMPVPPAPPPPPPPSEGATPKPSGALLAAIRGPISLKKVTAVDTSALATAPLATPSVKDRPSNVLEELKARMEKQKKAISNRNSQEEDEEEWT